MPCFYELDVSVSRKFLSVRRIIFESLDSVFGFFGFWLISGSQSWIPVDGFRQSSLHTLSHLAKKKRSLSAAGAIFGVILRVNMRNILVGAAGELRFVDCRRGVRLMADFRCLDSHRISSLAPGKLDSSFWILWILLDIEPLRIQRIQRNPTIRRSLAG